MANFVFAYHGGNAPKSKEEGERVMAEWGAWYANMGDAVAYDGGPVGMSQTVSQSGVSMDGGTNPISGVSVISAKNIEAAVEMAKGCPMVKDGSGNVEVAEMMEM